MRYERYESAQKFLDVTADILYENEAQNNLIICNAERGIEKAKADCFFATVKDDAGGVLLSALCTPPHNLVLYETGNKPQCEAVKLLARETAAEGITFPGVLCEEGLAQRFAEEYASASGKRIRPEHNMNILKLTSLSDLPKVPGKLRALTADDLYFAPYWDVEFSRECNLAVPVLKDQIEKLKELIPKQNRFIWEDGKPVSQAANGRNTQNGAVINAVYTPPMYRGKGYATACVGEVSRRLLEQGKQFCMLFADAENPISNGVYQKIGYRHVCVVGELVFEDVGG